MQNDNSKIGVVIIGRNEGERLIRCLESILKLDSFNLSIVYVDSASSDESCDNAKRLGAEVLNLDMSIPFSAARARNIGWRFLADKNENIEFIQFIDGDCEIHNDWITVSESYLRGHQSYAVACGRRREKYPQNSLFNRICDDEWNTPVGDAKSFGGDALVRVAALKEVSGYKDYFVAGEEPEVSYRLRRAGWRIARLDTEMTMHDAAIFTLQQWWNRSKRAGFAYALMIYEHGIFNETRFAKRCLSALFFCGIVSFALIFTVFISPIALLLLLIPLIQLLRNLYKGQDWSNYGLLKNSLDFAAKVPQFFGMAKCLTKIIFKKSYSIIEYK